MQRRDGLDSFSYRRLLAMVDHAAAFLGRHGLRPGERCAILAENDAYWCAVYLGALRRGAVAVPLDTAYNATQVAKLLDDCGATQLVVSPRLLGVAREASERMRGTVRVLLLRPGVEDDGVKTLLWPDVPDDGETGEEPAVVDAQDTAVILYTSGTTSDPKGVVLTHGNVAGEIEAVFQAIPVDEHDAILGVLPLFHALAQMANLTLPLTVGARVVFLETVNTTELLRALKERETTVLACVPQFFYLIHERVFDEVAKSGLARRLLFRLLLRGAGRLREIFHINLGRRLFSRVHDALGPRMRLWVTGGSRFDPQIGRDLYRMGFNLVQAYGLTETSGGATVVRPGDRHVSSVGQPLPGVEARIVPCAVADQGGTGESPNGIGEIALRGPIVTPGYYRRPDATAEVLRDGWFHTGDLGYVDSAGRIYITGRAKELIVTSSGKNIYPEEIEAHYAQSPYIAELCVLGRSSEGSPAAERLHAVVVPNFELLRRKRIVNSGEIVRFEIEGLSAHLPRHKRVLSYDIVTEPLPRTTTRKLKRFEIERLLAEGSRPSATGDTGGADADDEEHALWVADPHVAAAVEAIRGAARDGKRVRADDNLELDLGLDSMERVELLTALEVRFGVSVPEEVSQSIYTVSELVEAVRPSDEKRAGRSLERGDAWRHLLDQEDALSCHVAEILKRRPLQDFVLYALARVLFVVCKVSLGLRVVGRDRLPRGEPFLICPNHQSFVDAFVLATTLPYRVFRDVFYVGDSTYFTGAFGERLARFLHVVPVDPDSNLLQAMRAGANGLRQGKVLVLFPEGERSIDPEVKRFKKGAAILSLNTGAPIVPVALDGMHELWPRGKSLRLRKFLPFSGARTDVRYGDPIRPDQRSSHSEDDYAGWIGRVRDAVIELLESLRADRGLER